MNFDLLRVIALFIMWGVLGFVVYFLPALVGRNKRNGTALLALNLFLGWTLIGWVGALVWALCAEAPIPQTPPTILAATNPCLCAMCGKYWPPDSTFCSQCGQAFTVYQMPQHQNGANKSNANSI
jgi:hypothetical protein